MGWAARANPNAQKAKRGELAPKVKAQSQALMRDVQRRSGPLPMLIFAALGLSFGKKG